jgi:hypothetical protein
VRVVVVVLMCALLGMASFSLARAGGGPAPSKQPALTSSSKSSHTQAGPFIRTASPEHERGASILGSLCATVEMMAQRGCEECPTLSSELCQLIRAADPAAFAAGRGLVVVDERVRVEIELLEDPEGVAMGFDLVVEAQYGALLQALAPLQTLCDLANDPRVLLVRAPIPLTPN